MILLVCGGRDYKDRNLVWRILDTMIVDLLVHGGCKSGADFFADLWARNRRQRVKEYPAEWEKHGNAAGPIRNGFMLEDAKPHFVLAFPGGKGTANMVAFASQAKIPVLKVNW